LLERAYGRPRVLRAHRLLLDAFAAAPQSTERVRRARLAERQFGVLGWMPHRAMAFELAGDADAARSLYAAMGAAHATVTATAPQDDAVLGVLSQRQRQIAELVALGATNRAIAERLHISEHTVEHHVSNVFSRLNVRSRAQLTALVVGRRNDLA
jgi:DNA-binding NarL/FixJ family response regulator